MPLSNLSRTLTHNTIFKAPRVGIPTAPQRLRHDLVPRARHHHQPPTVGERSKRAHHNKALIKHSSKLGLQRRPAKFDVLPPNTNLPTPRQQLQSEMRDLVSDIRGLCFDLKKDLRGMNSSLKDMSKTLEGINEDLDKMKWHVDLFVFFMISFFSSLLFTAIGLEVIHQGGVGKMVGEGAESEVD